MSYSMKDVDPAIRLDGKALAADIQRRLCGEVQTLVAEHGVTPGLAVILVGAHAASRTYVRSKRRKASHVGLDSFDHDLAATTSQADLLARIDRLNRDERVHGIQIGRAHV